jgi:hypothetical protein
MAYWQEAHFRIGYKVLNSRPSTTESYLAWIECHEEVNIQSFVITMYTKIDPLNGSPKAKDTPTSEPTWSAPMFVG